MKKKILFVMPSLEAGGGEKSLINLLNQIDYEQYDVDLFLFHPEGLFLRYLPREVRILPLPESYRLFIQPYFKSVYRLIIQGKLSLVYYRTLFFILNRSRSNHAVREQRAWRYLSKSLEKIGKLYDATIGFLEKTSTYYCVEKADGRKKIGWVHIDYDQMGMDSSFDLPYFQQLDVIVTVSEECANVLRKRFPSESGKIQVIYNIVSPDMIHRMADIEDRRVFNKSGDELILLSIGRLHKQKGFDLAIEACKHLVEQGYNIKWHVIGEGEERRRLEDMIKKFGMEKHFKLLGLRANPYPYLKQADIYVQPSRFEGKSIAIDEAKIMNKPIVVTRFNTAKDQIEDGVDGLVVEMSPAAVSDGIQRLIQDPTLKSTLSDNLSRRKFGTEHEIDKLYQLIF